MEVVEVGGSFDLASSLWELRECEAFTDVSIVVKDGTVHAHKAMLVASYSPFKSLFQCGNDNEVILAKEFTTEEILNDVKELYFVRSKSFTLECLGLIGQPISTIEIVLTSNTPKMILDEEKPAKRKRKMRKIGPKRIKVKAEPLEDEDEDIYPDFSDDDPTFDPRSVVKVEREDDDGRRIKKSRKDDHVTDSKEVPKDPMAMIYNPKRSKVEQPTCVPCGMVFDDMTELEVHVQQHLQLTDHTEVSAHVIRCELCRSRSVYTTHDKYAKHFKTVHKKIKCLNCYGIFPNEKSDSHECEKSKHQCDPCKRNFATLKEWDLHKQCCHTYIYCQFCNRFFYDDLEKLKHEETCIKQLSRGSLKTMDSHPEDVQGDAFFCLHCDAVTTSVQLLRNHIRIAHFQIDDVNKRTKCLICGSVILRKNNRMHEEIHIREEYRRFSCDYCPSRFVSRTKKTEHENQVHTGEKPLKCKYCDMRFALSALRAAHQTKVCHGNPNRKGQDLKQKTTRSRSAWKEYGATNSAPLVAHNEMLEKMKKDEERFQAFQAKGKVEQRPTTVFGGYKELPLQRDGGFGRNIGGDVNSQILALLGGNRK